MNVTDEMVEAAKKVIFARLRCFEHDAEDVARAALAAALARSGADNRQIPSDSAALARKPVEDGGALAEKIATASILIYLKDEECWRAIDDADRAAIVTALEAAAPNNITGIANSNDDDWYARSDAEITPPSDVQK